MAAEAISLASPGWPSLSRETTSRMPMLLTKVICGSRQRAARSAVDFSGRANEGTVLMEAEKLVKSKRPLQDQLRRPKSRPYQGSI